MNAGTKFLSQQKENPKNMTSNKNHQVTYRNNFINDTYDVYSHCNTNSKESNHYHSSTHTTNNKNLEKESKTTLKKRVGNHNRVLSCAGPGNGSVTNYFKNEKGTNSKNDTGNKK